jgi:hypothetical protein
MLPVVQQWPDDSLERRAYDAVSEVPVVEENDRNRLGYHIFLYLKGELASIEEALHIAQPRMHCSKDEAIRMITSSISAAREGM